MLTTADLVWKREKRGGLFCWHWNSFILFEKLLIFMIFPTIPRSSKRTLRLIQIIVSWPHCIVASYSYCCILSGRILIVASYPEQSRSLDLIHIVASRSMHIIPIVSSNSKQFRLFHLIKKAYILKVKKSADSTFQS